MTRRSFPAVAAAAQLAAQTAAGRSPFCFFSKHLPELKYDELGSYRKSCGTKSAR
jgi:hypothetical protein